MTECTTKNIFERSFLGNLFLLLKKPIRLSTIDWAETYRILTNDESHHIGKFDCDKIPALEYVYNVLDNWNIPVVVVMKASQIGWSELTNNWLGKLIHTRPCKIQLVFPNLSAAKNYSREKLQVFFNNTKVLRDIINIGVAKESFNYFKFPGGFLKLVTAGAISSVKSSTIPVSIVEEPDDVKDDIGQGDTFELLLGRSKTFPIGYRKLVFGGTPTDFDFSRVDNAYKTSNQLVFKACCHSCNNLSELHSDNIYYDEYPDRYIDENFGKYDPSSARYLCPHCQAPWDKHQTDLNIRKGKEFGFIDAWGNHSKGWHPKKPEITETFGFQIPELISTMSSSDYVGVAKKKILAELAFQKGDEGLRKAFRNNTDGLAYSSGITAIEAEELKTYRLNYPEHIVPIGGLVLTAGVDCQENRFAVVIEAHGRCGNSWLVSWFEIFGNPTDEFDPIWKELEDKTIGAEIPTESGKILKIAGMSIDSADNTELVYKWVKRIAETVNPHVFAVKGVRDLRYSDDEIYQEPSSMDGDTDKKYRKTLAETMGVTLYKLGAHRAHEEVLTRLLRNRNRDIKANVLYFNEQSYGGFEEQVTSCRKLIDTESSYRKSVFKLIAGKRKEAIDCLKLSLHAKKAIGLDNYTHAHWQAIENYLHIN